MGWGVWGTPGDPAGVVGGLSSVEWWFAVVLGLTEAAFRNVGGSYVDYNISAIAHWAIFRKIASE